MKHLWNQRYASEEFIYGKHPNVFFQKCLINLKVGKIFLPAEGEGRNATYAAKLGWNVYAVDFSEEGKKKATLFAKQHGADIVYEVNNLACHHYREEHFDAVAVVYFHMKEKHRSKIIPKIFNSVKRGGAIILEVFSKNQINRNTGGPKDLDMLYTLDEFEQYKESFNFKIFEETTDFISEGTYHNGDSDIIRIFGFRK